MTYHSNDMETNAVLNAAFGMCTAARTAPKARGIDNIKTMVLKGADKDMLADTMDKLATYGKSKVAFVIGGSLGLSKDVMKRANDTLSFSKMTFPHQLMRVILLEQVYRSYRIINGEPYHK